MPEQMPPSRQAFNALLDTLKDIDSEFLNEHRNITSDSDIAAGELYLTHVLKAGLEIAVHNNAEYPHLSPLVSPSQKLGGDGADHYVYFAPIDGEKEYKIKGRKHGEVYISITTHTGDKDALWGTGVVSELNDNYIEFEADGEFEITLSHEEQDGNWMYIDKNTICVMTRHYYQETSPAAANPNIKPNIDITRLSPSTRQQTALSSEALAKRFNVLAAFIKGHTSNRPILDEEFLPDWYSEQTNQLPAARPWLSASSGGFSTIDNTYAACPFELLPKQALVIEGVMPECRYGGIALWNQFQQSFDYRGAQTSLNMKQIKLDKERRFKVVISAINPHCPNWLDTGGVNKGAIFWRFILAQDEVQTPKCTVVDLPIDDFK